MKFEGIEIALEGTVSGMKTTAENRRAGEGKGGNFISLKASAEERATGITGIKL